LAICCFVFLSSPTQLVVLSKSVTALSEVTVCYIAEVGCSGVRRKFSWGGLVQGHMVVICIWCALLVT